MFFGGVSKVKRAKEKSLTARLECVNSQYTREINSQGHNAASIPYKKCTNERVPKYVQTATGQVHDREQRNGSGNERVGAINACVREETKTMVGVVRLRGPQSAGERG